jgi:hypothetical protein
VRTPTTVTFRGDQGHFTTQKAAYIWLVKKFFDAYPQLLKDNSILGGYYFSRSPEELSEKTAEQAYNYEHIILLSGRWYVNVKLDNLVKRQILSNIGKRAGLVEGTDWSWRNSVTVDLLEDL